MRRLNLQASKLSLVVAIAVAGFTVLVLVAIYPSPSSEVVDKDRDGTEAHAHRENQRALPRATPEAGGQAAPGYVIQPPPPSPKPALRGKAAGQNLPFALNRRGSESSLFTHPMPRVYLVFESHTLPEKLPGRVQEEHPAVRVQLPARAKRELRSLWRSACYYYYLELKGPQDAESRVRRNSTFVVIRHNTSARLGHFSIEAPDGRRKILMDEGISLVLLLSDFAEANLRRASELSKHRKLVI